MEVEKLRVAQLPEVERNVLEQLYGGQMADGQGYSPNHIVYVRELTPVEKTLFSHTMEINPVGAILQNLYKIKGKLMPAHFTRAVLERTREEDAMRLNYCPVGDRILAVVLKERQQSPTVVYRNLEGLDEDDLDATLRRIIDADLRQGFDVRHGCLMRFSVFHTRTDEYAILVTAVQAVMTHFDVRQIFFQTMGMPWRGSSLDILPINRMSEMAASVREYWGKMLDNFPQNRSIPFYEKKISRSHKQRAYLTHIPANIVSDLRGRAKSNKRMLMSILQTAWGFLMQQENDCQDVGYGLLVPRREQADSSLGNVPSLVPVRLKVQGNPTVQELVTKAFQQFVVSQPYATLGWSDIEQILGPEKNFDHFLNFCDFFCESQSFSSAEGSVTGKLVRQNSWDGRDSKLGICFRQEERQLILSWHYEEESFSQKAIENLVKAYLLVVQQMLTDWNLDYAAYSERLRHRLLAEKAASQSDSLESRAIMQDYLSKLALLQECDKGIIQLFMEVSRLSVRFEGDRIADDEIRENFIFLVAGRASRSIETGDGWYYTLDIQKENSWLNETILLEKQKNNMAVEILTEQAVVLTIPLPSALLILEKSPLLGQNIIKHITRQMEKYQRLWIQS